MAERPDAHPDSRPSGSDDSPEQAGAGQARQRGKGVEDAPGDFAGTAGTGGENKVQDAEFER